MGLSATSHALALTHAPTQALAPTSCPSEPRATWPASPRLKAAAARPPRHLRPSSFRPLSPKNKNMRGRASPRRHHTRVRGCWRQRLDTDTEEHSRPKNMQGPARAADARGLRPTPSGLSSGPQRHVRRTPWHSRMSPGSRPSPCTREPRAISHDRPGRQAAAARPAPATLGPPPPGGCPPRTGEGASLRAAIIDERMVSGSSTQTW